MKYISMIQFHGLQLVIHRDKFSANNFETITLTEIDIFCK